MDEETTQTTIKAQNTKCKLQTGFAYSTGKSDFLPQNF